jgi:hypothetical protein
MLNAYAPYHKMSHFDDELFKKFLTKSVMKRPFESLSNQTDFAQLHLVSKATDML